MVNHGDIPHHGLGGVRHFLEHDPPLGGRARKHHRRRVCVQHRIVPRAAVAPVVHALGSVLKEARDEALAYFCPIVAALQRELPVERHVFFELRTDRLCTPQRRIGEGVLGRPLGRLLPDAGMHKCVVHVEQREVVAFFGHKLAPRNLRRDVHRGAVLERGKRRGDRRHRRNGQHLFGAPDLRCVEELGKSRDVLHGPSSDRAAPRPGARPGEGAGRARRAPRARRGT